MSTEDSIYRCKPPSPSLAISKRTVFMAGATFAVVLSASLAFRFNSEKESPAEIVTSGIRQAGFVSALPVSYDKLAREPKASKTTKLFVRPMDSAISDKELERQKRKDEARKSPLLFQNISIPTQALSGSSSSQSTEDKTTEATTTTSPRDDANRQDDKREFLTQPRTNESVSNRRLEDPISEYQLMAGAIIPCVLLSGINSDLPGQILGQVSENVFDTKSGKYLLIAQGSRIIGEYDSRIVYGQERALVVWNRIIFPNGQSFSLEGMPGVDSSGYGGLSDRVNNHYFKLISGAALSSLLGAGSQMAAGRNYSSFDPSYPELATQGFSRSLNDVGQEIVRRDLRVQPTIEIRPGSRFNVFVNKDLVLKLYEP